MHYWLFFAKQQIFSTAIMLSKVLRVTWFLQGLLSTILKIIINL